MKKPELLAPAGSWDSLVAAIEAGCDAVYLSGKLYGARSYANNFDNEELVRAINYAHMYGVKVYVTTNIIVYETEIKNFIKYIDFLYSNGVDAIIIQDLGMIDLVGKLYPDLELHVSTQAHVHNLEAVKLMEKLNVSRVVLARETPIELIDKIKNNTKLELEIFCHGALCISYSGECLMSSLIGGRSGNRGTCAQSCRQKYTLESNNKTVKEGYLLSTKDLNTLDNIDKLIDIGVDSLKIEGRMKRPEYVYLVVSIYRKAIDYYIENKKLLDISKYIIELKKIFNRKFTKGFIFHEDNNKFTNEYRPNHLGIPVGIVLQCNNRIKIKLLDNLNINDGIRIIDNEDIGFIVTSMYKNNKKVSEAYKDDIIEIPYKGKKISNNASIVKTTDYKQLKDIESKIKSKERKVPIDVYIECLLGNKVKIKVMDNINSVEVESDYIVENSINNSMSKESIVKKIDRLGDTVYKINNIDVVIDNNIFVPVGVLNNIRREAIDNLTSKRLYIGNKRYGSYSIDIPDYNIERNKNILIHSIYDYNKIKNDNYNEIYIDDIEEYNKINDNRLRLKIPRVIEIHDNYNVPLLIGELGSIHYSNNLVSDFSFNVVNSYTVALLHSLGIDRVTLSYELNDYQIKKLIDSYKERYNKHPNLEIIVDSIPEAMICKYKLTSDNNNYYLVDKYNNKFKIRIKDNMMYIYHYKRLVLDNQEHYYDIGINAIRYEKEC